jgi:hypothetical protein
MSAYQQAVSYVKGTCDWPYSWQLGFVSHVVSLCTFFPVLVPLLGRKYDLPYFPHVQTITSYYVRIIIYNFSNSIFFFHRRRILWLVATLICIITKQLWVSRRLNSAEILQIYNSCYYWKEMYSTTLLVNSLKTSFGHVCKLSANKCLVFLVSHWKWKARYTVCKCECVAS